MLSLVTDLGSNNFTMAPEIQKQLEDHAEAKRAEGNFSDFEWDSVTMHVRCMAHKVGLIVNAGLDALGIGTKRIRHATIGNFPAFEAMDTIEEEGEDETELPESDVAALAETLENPAVISADDSDIENEPEELSWSDDPDPDSEPEDDEIEDDEPPTRHIELKRAGRRPTDLHTLTADVSFSIMLSVSFPSEEN